MQCAIKMSSSQSPNAEQPMRLRVLEVLTVHYLQVPMTLMALRRHVRVQSQGHGAVGMMERKFFLTVYFPKSPEHDGQE